MRKDYQPIIGKSHFAKKRAFLAVTITGPYLEAFFIIVIVGSVQAALTDSRVG